MEGPRGADMVGVGVYRLSKDRSNCFTATWYATNAAQPLLGSGIGHGDTSNGYCGTHQIRYYRADGELSDVPLELTIKAVGEVRELTWSHQGKPRFKGIGIESGDQLVMTYWPVSG